MGSKSKWIGLIILLVVIGAAAVYLLLGGGPRPEPTVLRGYVGGREDRPAGGRGGNHPAELNVGTQAGGVRGNSPARRFLPLTSMEMCIVYIS